VTVTDSSIANYLSTAIGGASAAIEAQTGIAMATADWSSEQVITSAPTLTALFVSAANVVTVPTASASGAIAATGDPHLMNIFGQRFDLMQAGRHVLVQIPRGAGNEGTLLRVEADAQSLGRPCKDMYFQEVNLSGKWVELNHVGGLQFRAADNVTEAPTWLRFGRVELKVVHGRTLTGVSYLNLYVKHLRSAGLTVGGLLGMDDHTQEATPPTGCLKEMSLISSSPMSLKGMSLLSLADALDGPVAAAA
jgi:hypothetical protein